MNDCKASSFQSISSDVMHPLLLTQKPRSEVFFRLQLEMAHVGKEREEHRETKTTLVYNADITSLRLTLGGSGLDI